MAHHFKEEDIDGKASVYCKHCKPNNYLYWPNICSIFCTLIFFFSEFRECFYLFAREGTINKLDELSVIMRSLGMSPTITELKKYFSENSKYN